MGGNLHDLKLRRTGSKLSKPQLESGLQDLRVSHSVWGIQQLLKRTHLAQKEAWLQDAQASLCLSPLPQAPPRASSAQSP